VVIVDHLLVGKWQRGWSDKNKGMMEGYTDNYIKITAPYKKEWVNEIVDWKI
jgi:threonylcarbamoyladenosine tRNA methylthiotransferase MtaB